MFDQAAEIILTSSMTHDIGFAQLGVVAALEVLVFYVEDWVRGHKND